jgi:hypothetical protein
VAARNLFPVSAPVWDHSTNNLARCQFVREPLGLAHRGRLDTAVSWPPDVEDEAPSQEHVALWRSEQRRLLDYLGGLDPMIGKLAELQLGRDLYETREICVALAATPSEVANLRKRMRRAVGTYLKGIQE